MSFKPLARLDEARLRRTEEMMCRVFGVEKLRPFQQETGQNVLLGRRTVLDVPTRAGKTLAFWYALFYHIDNWKRREECKKMVILVGPLSALLESQASVLEEVGMAAIALTALREEQRDTDIKVCLQMKTLIMY
jgi:superfamily II DNA helicase RecQ